MKVWIDGRLVTGDEARISVRDRSLEHGLGLFETMRANPEGHVPLLSRHLRRIARSAAALDLPMATVRWPVSSDIAELCAAHESTTGSVVRLTLSAGTADKPPSAWMVLRSMPAPLARDAEVRIAGRFLLDPDDELNRHKTLNHWRRRRLMERCRAQGVFESIGHSPDGRLWEAIWANLFLVREGVLVTPTLEGPVLPGVMRSMVIERARSLGMPILETDVKDLGGEEIFLTNAVRGIVPVTHCDGRALPIANPITIALLDDLRRWLSWEVA